MTARIDPHLEAQLHQTLHQAVAQLPATPPVTPGQVRWNRSSQAPQFRTKNQALSVTIGRRWAARQPPEVTRWAVVAAVARFGLPHRHGLSLLAFLLVGAGLLMVCGGAVMLLNPLDPPVLSWLVGLLQQKTPAATVIVAGATAQIAGALLQSADSYDRRVRSERVACSWGHPVPALVALRRLTGPAQLGAGLGAGVAGAFLGSLIGAAPLELANPILRTALNAPRLNVWATPDSAAYRAVQAVMALLGAAYGVRAARFFWARRPAARISQDSSDILATNS